MGRVDFDRNGTLDLEEFISGLIDWTEVSLTAVSSLRMCVIKSGSCSAQGNMAFHMGYTSVASWDTVKKAAKDAANKKVQATLVALTSGDAMVQLQKDGDWESRVDAAFAKLDSNGDGYIDLEELLAQLPFETEESYDGERLMEVM